jgi:hypothetical protein
VDVLKKIDSIKDKEERDEIRRSFMGNLSQLSLPNSHETLSPLQPPATKAVLMPSKPRKKKR